MNPSNTAWRDHVEEWMQRKGVDKNGKVNVEAVMKGVGGITMRPSREAINAVLEELFSLGVLAREGSNFKLTGDGELYLYPGSEADLVGDVSAEIINHMNQKSSETFSLLTEQIEIRQRLNPRQKLVFNKAIQALVDEGYWIASGPQTYKLCP